MLSFKHDFKQTTRDFQTLFQGLIGIGIDADGNGSISRQELLDHLSTAGYGEAAIEQLFDKMDKNQDDSISPEEFREGFEILPKLRSAPGMGNYNSQFMKEIHVKVNFDSLTSQGMICPQSKRKKSQIRDSGKESFKFSFFL